MQNKITIGITTFSKRLNLIIKLIDQIRTYTNDKIILTVNGERDGEFNDLYRLGILKLCSKYKDVFPVFFIEIRGLSKLWNTIIIHSDRENVLILNDDIEILSDDLFKTIDSHISSNLFNGLSRINGSFSHFLINKSIIEHVGFFDERLLGFGEEDGDICYRFLKSALPILDINTQGVLNLCVDTRHDQVKKGIEKYSKFNRDFIYGQKYAPDFNSPYRGMFDTPMRQLLPDVNCYPQEKFYCDHKNELFLEE